MSNGTADPHLIQTNVSKWSCGRDVQVNGEHSQNFGGQLTAAMSSQRTLLWAGYQVS